MIPHDSVCQTRISFVYQFTVWGQTHLELSQIWEPVIPWSIDGFHAKFKPSVGGKSLVLRHTLMYKLIERYKPTHC